ncbi:MAG: protein kinase [Akkermansiaceae bacterium]|tara:strand:+ start:32137 stop:34677 length:2541 start_codon:yes stop_codon:yes gene_type:complete
MEQPSETINFEAPSIEDLQPLFPSYEIEDFIAQGGMGAVYKARQISLDRPVAIKILPREFGADPTFRASFEAEAKAMARLNHPNLIGVYDFGEADGMLFLVMECVHGKSLYHSSYGKAIDPTQAAKIVIAICRGLDHAHTSDILHRDVKPANILLSPDATPKIGDFGLASPMNETASADETIYGTPGYTAPEIIHRFQVDRRADIFSTGVILHELLAGALPDEAKTPPSMISGCPRVFDAIVARSTQSNPQLRYTTAAELADDLEKALKATPVATRLNLTPAAGTGTPIAKPSSIVTIPKKSSPALVATLVILGIAAVSVGVYLSSQKKDTPLPTTAETPTIPSPKPELPPTPLPKKLTPEKPTPITVSKPAPKIESPRQALAKLKEKLASGARDEFPEGTLEHNGSHFLHLKQPVKWQDALRFAEDHGAHLAIASTNEDKNWLSQSFKTNQPTWLGAGIAANEKWQWLDTSEWNTDDNITATSKKHRVVAFSPEGNLTSSQANQTFGFILQWRNDGSNPCTLDAQLKRTADSVEKNGIEKARYPVGTRTYQKSHFLLLSRSSTWENAHQLAKSYKAQLAVPSSAIENQWMTSTFAAKSSYWLGGYLLKPSDPWQWTTRETWHSSGWQPGEPKSDPAHNRLLMESSSNPQSWTTSQGAKGEADAILIEWSAPKRAATVGSFDLEKWFATVNRKVKDRVRPDVEAYEKDRDNRIDKYIREMKRAAKKIEIPQIPGRGGRGGRGNFLVNLVNEAMDEVEESGELPESIPERAPESFHEIHDETEKDLIKIDADYQVKIEAHLEFYTKGLLKKSAELAQAGFYPTSKTIKESAEDIGEDTSKFLGILGL